jgi:hypothetical protein
MATMNHFKSEKLEARVKELERRVKVLYTLTLIMRGRQPPKDARYADLFDKVAKSIEDDII